jgi:cupin superfamily acireductone dioxygenase involved in methionine salvage
MPREWFFSIDCSEVKHYTLHEYPSLVVFLRLIYGRLYFMLQESDVLKWYALVLSGVVDNILSVGNGIDTWNTRFATSSTLNEQQRVQLFEQIEGWVTALSESVANIGSFRRPASERQGYKDEEVTG